MDDVSSLSLSPGIKACAGEYFILVGFLFELALFFGVINISYTLTLVPRHKNNGVCSAFGMRGAALMATI